MFGHWLLSVVLLRYSLVIHIHTLGTLDLPCGIEICTGADMRGGLTIRCRDAYGQHLSGSMPG